MSDIILNKEDKNQLKDIQNAFDISKNPTIQESVRIASKISIQQSCQKLEPIYSMSDQLSMLSKLAKNSLKVLLPENVTKQYSEISRVLSETMQPIIHSYSYEHMIENFKYLESLLTDFRLIYYYPDDMSNEEALENEKVNNKIVTEIFKQEENDNKSIYEEDSAIITLSPINEKVLKYLSENPHAFYQLGDREFEIVMAEIYSRLGYKVELTKATRDGGKDIIIRKPDILGDFIYYVECKQNAPKRHIGVGLIRNLIGTINTDRVNGGILATTSYFTPDAKKFITDNKYDYQIQMHDYDMIRKLLDRAEENRYGKRNTTNNR